MEWMAWLCTCEISQSFAGSCKDLRVVRMLQSEFDEVQHSQMIGGAYAHNRLAPLHDKIYQMWLENMSRKVFYCKHECNR